MPASQLPLEYIYGQHTHFLVHAPCADEALAVLSGEQGGGEPMAGGRGGVARIVFQEGHAILRPCRRGGLIRHLLSDAYLFINRPREEFLVHCKAFEAGAPVPEPLGVRWQRKAIVVRGALLTRFVAAEPLAKAALRDPADEDCHRVAGAAVSALHAAGVLHADLNAHNILVEPGIGWVVDLDRARAVSSASRWQRARNLLRLRRSYAKLGISMERFNAFMEGYGPISLPGPLQALHAFRQSISGNAR